MSLLVALMGIAFLVTAWKLQPVPLELLRGATLPRFPEGAGVLILGLVGTTVVPYNLFLGSALARGQSLPMLRFGLAIAVGLGGVISMGIVVVGSALEGGFAFERLAAVLADRLGAPARTLFAVGLFAAGLSSAITAPLAAAITARGLFAASPDDPRWSDRSPRFRGVWAAVLSVGVGFGLAGIRPVPAIVLAQALNGLLLPLVAVFLWLTVNDRRLMGDAGVNRVPSNTAMALVVLATLLLGASGLTRAGAAALGLGAPDPGTVTLVASVVSALLAIPIVRGLLRRRATGRDRG